MLARNARFVLGPAIRVSSSAAGEPGERLAAVDARGDDLREHGVIIWADNGALFRPCVDADAGTCRVRRLDQPTCRGPEIFRGILGIKPRLDRVAAQKNLLLPERQLFPGRHAELPLDEIEPGHRFGHRMLDLQPCIHLDEKEVFRTDASRGFRDELHRTSALIADSDRRFYGRFAEREPSLLRKARRRRLLQNLLVAALYGAISLEEMHDVAVLIGKNLHLDMAWRLDEAFDQDLLVAEG